ncbi:MAG: TrkA family potassium uptake protein [Clostridia bacterium]|nr:TrkA family potassium uptake protein [Clostridia bacterium]
MGKQSFLVIGMGRFGRSTARTLAQMGCEVLVIDKAEDRIDIVKDDVLHAIIADTTEERTLTQLDMASFNAVVICIGKDLRASILTTVLCKEQGAKRVISKAQDELHAKLLLKTGADEVVQPEHDAGIRLARSLPSDDVLDSLDLTEDYSVNEMHVPKDWVDKTLSSLALRTHYGVSVIAIMRDGVMRVNNNPAEKLQAADTLFVVGDNAHLQKLIED